MTQVAGKQYRLAVSGLDCPKCAVKLEDAIKKVPGVLDATIDFGAGFLHITTTTNNAEATLSEVFAAADRVEPSARFYEASASHSDHQDHHQATGEEAEAPPWLRLAIGSVLYAFALLWPGEAPIWAFFPAYFTLGGRTVWHALRNTGRGQLFDESFLMSLATVGAFVIGEYPEAVAVMLFYEIGELFQEMAVGHSRRSIRELVDLRPDYANLIDQHGDLERVDPNTVSPGMLIAVKPGERVPLDGEVLEGVSLVDTSSLTGESTPRQARVGDEVLAGFVNQTAVLQVRVTKSFNDSAIARVLEMTETASARKAPTERFITRFSRYYTPVVVGCATGLAVLPPLFTGQNWQDWIYRGLVFLVVSCPCALVLSVPLGFFGGIGGAARQGILVKGAHFLEGLTRVRTVVFDKTGTLTKGVFKVVDIQPEKGTAAAQLLALAAAGESFSLHPIATSIRQAAGHLEQLPKATDFEEIAGEGVLCRVNGEQVGVGNSRLMHRLGLESPQVDANGAIVYIAAAGVYQGHLVISDELKDNAKVAIQQLRQCGVNRLVMLTGDRWAAANAVARELGLDEAHAELLPDGKVAVLEQLSSGAGNVMFVGDGINDAPVLARADVGVAMGALGSDAAIEAADVVLMTDELSRIPAAIAVSRHTRKIVWQNIWLSFVIKGAVLVFGAAGISGLWEAVFADVGVALLAVLNSLRALRTPTAV